jgi:hypothetical protein
VTTAGDDTTTPEPPADLPVTRDAVVRDVVVVLVTFLVAGVAVGVLWPQLVEPVMVTRTDVGLSTGEVPLTRRFEHDAWYSLLGGGAALFLGVLLTLWRRAHETVTLVAVVLAALLAAAVSSFVGTAVGPEPADVVLAEAEVGATAPDELTVTADAAYLAWPLGAVVGAVVVLWAPSAGARAGSRGDREHTPGE